MLSCASACARLSSAARWCLRLGLLALLLVALSQLAVPRVGATCGGFGNALTWAATAWLNSSIRVERCSRSVFCRAFVCP